MRELMPKPVSFVMSFQGLTVLNAELVNNGGAGREDPDADFKN